MTIVKNRKLRSSSVRLDGGIVSGDCCIERESWALSLLLAARSPSTGILRPGDSSGESPPAFDGRQILPGERAPLQHVRCCCNVVCPIDAQNAMRAQTIDDIGGHGVTLNHRSHRLHALTIHVR